MPENMTCWPPFLAAKEQGTGAILAFAMAYLRAYNGGAFTKTVIDATDAPLSPSSFVTFSTSPGLSSNLAYITSVYRLHHNDLLSAGLNVAKQKAGVEDGRNQ